MQQFKELHVATSLDSLNRIALDMFKDTNYKKQGPLMNIAKKLYQMSQSDPYDEERSYVYLSRFLIIYHRLMLLHNDKPFVQSFFSKDVINTKAQLEDMRLNLNKRYEEETAKRNIPRDVSMSQKLVKEGTPKVFNNANFISCSQLFSALNRTDIELLIMDIRNESDYEQSHVSNTTTMNIPESLIQSGLSAHRLGEKLAFENFQIWHIRDSFNAIVLMDWSTSKTTFLASKLDKLKTILVEWDVGRCYNEKPVILDCGYLEWLEMYPTFCTDPHVKYSKINTELDELLDLEQIEYPTDAEPKSHEVFNKELNKDISSKIIPISSRDDILKEELLVVEKNNKICKEILKREQEWQNLHDLIKDEYDITKLASLKRKEKATEDEISKLSLEEVSLLERRSTLADNLNLSASFKPEEGLSEVTSASLKGIDKFSKEHLDAFKARQSLSENRQRLLDEARQAKKPLETFDYDYTRRPIINRATKPKSIPIKSIVNIEGRYQTVKYGLTGLTNIRNTCYMNAIIQCFRHIPEIIDFYCNGEYTKHLHKSPSFISNEVAHLIRALWSNHYSVIKPSEFYIKFILLSPSYKNGAHEDCMEFFLQLFNYLNEDCVVEIAAKSFWSETQMAWFKQHGGKISFFINSFYHQIKVQQYCRECNNNSFKFEIENVFYLTTPDKPFTLEECMKAYLRNSDKFTCKLCKTVKEVRKSISYYPTILVISLKRHVQGSMTNTGPCYKKNEHECDFPIDDFQVGKCMYKLHAIAMHVGSMDSGHYTAACLNPTNDNWYIYNDEDIIPFNINDHTVKVKAYSFFYSLKRGTDKRDDKQFYSRELINLPRKK